MTDEEIAERARAGRLLGGRYRLAESLGSGGFGQVWKANDETLGVPVAVKGMRLPPGTDAEQGERLARAEREARNAARLRDHPNIVTVHDVVVDGGVPWIVMRLVTGRSLEQRLREEGPLQVEEAARVATSLLNALGAAHAAGILHRDVKPANVMLADNGGVLLTDFGIAVHQADTALTATGLIIGSSEYLAPERADGATRRGRVPRSQPPPGRTRRRVRCRGRGGDGGRGPGGGVRSRFARRRPPGVGRCDDLARTGPDRRQRHPRPLRDARRRDQAHVQTVGGRAAGDR
ncbi:serine/threonine-protein kinase [Actinomadura sp. K4S16]|uniref:serine/threonine-protein kinase n=1 Tax=Actinomadura sp. K4S16 TaxID=1316147 RepID=UPI0011ECC48C|nr:serine/threonine-protein kinase [Actinomadura sp. K4S16]